MSHADQRSGLCELNFIECQEHLRANEGRVGRLAFSAGDRPLIFPINYTMRDGRLLFRTADGVKLRAAREGRRMAFEIDGVDPVTRSGWSVVYGGRSSVADDPALRTLLSTLALDPYPEGHFRQWVTVEPEEVTGRRIVHPPTW